MRFNREVKEKDMSKLTVMVEKGDTRKTWNYVLPKQHKSTIYSPLQSIPPLTQRNNSLNRLKKRKTRKR